MQTIAKLDHAVLWLFAGDDAFHEADQAHDNPRGALIPFGNLGSTPVYFGHLQLGFSFPNA